VFLYRAVEVLLLGCFSACTCIILQNIPCDSEAELTVCGRAGSPFSDDRILVCEQFGLTYLGSVDTGARLPRLPTFAACLPRAAAARAPIPACLSAFSPCHYPFLAALPRRGLPRLASRTARRNAFIPVSRPMVCRAPSFLLFHLIRAAFRTTPSCTAYGEYLPSTPIFREADILGAICYAM